MTAGSSSKTIRGNQALETMFCKTASNQSGTELLPSSFALLCRRLRALGIDPRIVALSHPDVYMSLADVCASCSRNRRCLDDMADGRSGVRAGKAIAQTSLLTLRTLH